jgi:hypothetical protein
MCAKYHFSNFQNTHGFIFPGLPGFNWQKFPIMKKFTPATPQILRLRGGNFAYPTLNTRWVRGVKICICENQKIYFSFFNCAWHEIKLRQNASQRRELCVFSKYAELSQTLNISARTQKSGNIIVRMLLKFVVLLYTWNRFSPKWQLVKRFSIKF